MKKLIAMTILFGASACSFAQVDKAASDGARSSFPDGILESVQNADLAAAGDALVITRKDHNIPVEMVFTNCQGLGVDREYEQWWVLPISAKGAQISANKHLWILPLDAKSKDHSWDIELQDGGMVGCLLRRPGDQRRA